MVVKKGKLQDYDQWVPEYTPKTHNLTKQSQERLNEIRAQASAEEVISNLDINGVVEGASFVGLVALFYYGINPAIFGLIDFGKEFVKDAVEAWTSFSVYIDDALGNPIQTEVKTLLPPELTDEYVAKAVSDNLRGKELVLKGIIKKISLHERENELARKGIKQSEDSLVNLHEQLPLAKTPVDTDRINQIIQFNHDRITNLEELINANELRIIELQAGADAISRDIRMGKDAKSFTAEEGAKFLKDIQRKNILIALGEAGAVRWLLKSYEMAEVVENATITG